MEPVNAAIIYYSATGTRHALARAVAEGAGMRAAGLHGAAGRVGVPLEAGMIPAGVRL
jgi:hypothetical protein